MKLDDSFTVTRKKKNVKRDNGTYYEDKLYVFLETSHTFKTEGGVEGGVGAQEKGQRALETSKSDPATGFHSSFHTPSTHLSKEKCVSHQPPQHQDLTKDPHTTFGGSAVFSTVSVSESIEVVSGVDGKTGAGIGKGGVIISDNLSSVVPLDGGDMSYSLLRKKSDLVAVADTLAATTGPLALDLKTYSKNPEGSKNPNCEIRLLCIKALGSPAWLLDLKELGYGLGDKLRDVLSSREIISYDSRVMVGGLRDKCVLQLSSVWCANMVNELLRWEHEQSGSSKMPSWEQRLLLLNAPHAPEVPCTFVGKLNKPSDRLHGTYWRDELTKEQYEYAAASVEYLFPLNAVLEEALANSPMLHTFRYIKNRELRYGTIFRQPPTL